MAFSIASANSFILNSRMPCINIIKSLLSDIHPPLRRVCARPIYRCRSQTTARNGPGQLFAWNFNIVIIKMALELPPVSPFIFSFAHRCAGHSHLARACTHLIAIYLNRNTNILIHTYIRALHRLPYN